MRGRPKKEDSRDKQYRVRLNNDEDEMLTYASDVTGKQKSEIFRQALVEYFKKVRVNEYVLEGVDADWEMDHISLKRVIDCPYCNAANRMDFEDECDTLFEERQMGAEITYSFDLKNCECQSCGRAFRVSGRICEYPVGAYNYEDIKVERNVEEDK